MKNQTDEIKQPESTFKLETDLDSFSFKMSEEDTLFIFADLSLCTYFRNETDIITKQGNDLFIGSTIREYIGEQIETELKKVKYEYHKTDSLNFENMFTYLKVKQVNISDNTTPDFSFVHKQDTIQFYSNSMGDKENNIRYYLDIKRRLYPDEEIYEPITAPTPEE